MSRPSKTVHKLDTHFSLRMTSAMRRRLRTTGERLEMEDAEALRIAARIGMQFLHRIDYDLEGSVIERAMRGVRRGKAG